MRVVPFLVGALSLAVVLWLGGCGGGGGDKREAVVDTSPVNYGSSRDFPVPAEIQPNVNFWRNVYGVWGRSKVAFHDDEHMGVIYEVAELPGPTMEGYTNEQRAFVRARLDYYKDKARDLERKVSANLPLSPAEQSILAKFDRDGGRGAVFGAAERVRSQRGLRDRFRRGLEISGRYDKSFRQIMRAQGLPEDLAYLPHVESSFQMNAVSSAGATGVWQFMPATGRSFMNVNGAVDDRLCPIVSAEGAARYLSQAHDRLGTWPLAITSYNHGQGGMANAKAQFGHDFGRIVKNYQGKAFKFASRNYYAEFLAAREVAGHPQRYFPEGVRYESPWPHERLILASTMPADAVARHYGVSTLTLASANPHWRATARDGRTDLPAGTTVWVPAGSKSRAGQPAFAASASAARGAFGRPVAEAAAAAAFRATKAEPVLAALPERESAAEFRAPRSESVFGGDEGAPVRRAATPPRSAPAPAGSGSELALAEARRAAEASAKLPVADEWNAQYSPIVSNKAPVRGRRGRVDATPPWADPSLADPSLADPSLAAAVAPVRSEPRPQPAPARAPLADFDPDFESALDPAPARVAAAAEVRRAEPVRTEPRPARPVAPAIAEPRVAVSRAPEPRLDEPLLSEPRIAGLDLDEPEPRLAAADPDVDVDADADADVGTVEPEPRRVKASRRAARSESRVARAETRTSKSEPKAAPAEVKIAKAEPKAVPKAAKADAKAARIAKTGAKSGTKDAKGERTAKADPKDAKADAKAARTAKTDGKAGRTARGDAKGDAKADAKADARTAKADAKDAKGAKAAKTAKADAKDAKGDAKAAKTAKADAKAAKGDAKAAKTAKADTKGAKGDAKTAKADAKTAKADAKVAKADKAAAKVHVVKPQETLFRVASGNGISVQELRRLNKLGPNNNQVRPGQKLKVGT